MQERVTIQAEHRSKTGSAEARRLRRQGKLPAVLYGHEVDGLALSVEARAMDRLMGAEGFSGVIDLKLANDTEGLNKEGPLLVLIKQYQADPITRALLHIDLYKVNLQEKVSVTVPVHMEGTAPGVKAGGILDVVRREIEITCLPDNIPEFLVADVSSLELGDSVHVQDLRLPEGVSALADTNFTIATIAAPTKIEEAPAAEEAAEAEEPAAAEAKGEAKKD